MHSRLRKWSKELVVLVVIFVVASLQWIGGDNLRHPP